MVKYFCNFHEFHNDHENFCHEIFLTAAYSTGVYTSKSRKTSESRKSGKTTEIWSYTVIQLEMVWQIVWQSTTKFPGIHYSAILMVDIFDKLGLNFGKYKPYVYTNSYWLDSKIMTKNLSNSSIYFPYQIFAPYSIRGFGPDYLCSDLYVIL